MNQRITFCDTNILRYLIDHPEKWTAFRRYLAETETSLSVSMIQLLEFEKLPNYYYGLLKLLSIMPANMLNWWKNILADEIKLYPVNTNSNINLILGNVIDGIIYTPSKHFSLKEILESNEISLLWDSFEQSKDHYMPVLSWLPSTSPKPSADQNIDFTLHNFGFVLSEIRDVDNNFIPSFKGRYDELVVEAFKGSYLRAAYTYYRYIRNGMSPERSDVGDILQVFYMPYCANVIVEKSMAGFLYQLQRDKGLLNQVKIKTIRFVRNLPSQSA
jgi:hypothetical protein